MSSNKLNQKAIIIDATGLELTKEERDLFSSEKPAGFILFKRNCVSRQQIRALVTSVRECVGDDHLPVLIDQEGGTVARLHQPVFTEYPPAKIFGQIMASSAQEGFEATRINSYLMALDLADMGVSVNCAPVVDVPSPDCHEFLSASRTYSDDPDMVAKLGEAVCRGLLDGGVTPVMKHIPGHGRAVTDSHFELPVVGASREILSKTDFKPFKYLANTDMKIAVWAMAAHVVYSAVDPDSAATISKRVTDEVIRGEMGFDGVLLADNVGMDALGGTFATRVAATMAAGMDLTMLCSGTFDERVEALSATPKVAKTAAARIEAAEKARTAWLKNGNDNKEQLKEKLARIYERSGSKV